MILVSEKDTLLGEHEGRLNARNLFESGESPLSVRNRAAAITPRCMFIQGIISECDQEAFRRRKKDK